MADTSLVFNIIGKDKATGVVEGTARRVRAASLLAAAGQIALGAGFASAAAQALALVAALGPTISVLGLIPAVGLGGIAVIGTLGLGFMGLGKALTATAGGGGGAARSLSTVAAAERRVAQAQREAKIAQDAINDARKTAADRIASYGRQIEGATLDEERATLALAAAKKRFEEASMRTGPGAAEEYADAALAVKENEFALQGAKDRTKELKQEQATAAKEGVEGSQEVTDARRREADAVQAVKDAQDALKQATRGTAGGGGVNAQAEAMAKLAPNARAVVRTILELLPTWQRLQRAVQNRMWQGVATDIRALSASYVPVLRTRLVGLAGSFNLTMRESAKLATSAGFVHDVDTVLGSTVTTSMRLARSVAPIINGFRQWAAVGASFLPAMGSSVLSLAQRFERWSVAVRESGKMRQWMAAGIGVLRQLGTIAVNVLGIITAILRPQAGAGQQLLTTITNGITRLRAFLNTAQGQQKVATIFGHLRSILSGVMSLLPYLATAAGNLGTSLSDASGGGAQLRDTLHVAGIVMGFLADHAGALATVLPYLAGGFAIVKTAQVAGNVAAAASIPLKVAEVVSQFALRSALRAHTIALGQNTAATGGSAVATEADTVATNTGVLARGRAVIGMVAQKAALVAGTVATGIGTAANWLMAASTWAVLGPILLVVAAVAIFAGGLYLLWTRSGTFRKIVTASFNAVWGAIKTGWSWVQKNWPLLLSILTGPIGLAVRYIVTHWDGIVAYFKSLPKRLDLSNIWAGIKNGFRAALNWVIGAWNNFSIGLPGFSFAGVSVPGIRINTPNIPYLATGGTARTGGFVNVGERGMERVWLPAGASVEPLRGNASAAGGVVRVVWDFRGADSELKRLIRKWIRTDNLLQGA